MKLIKLLFSLLTVALPLSSSLAMQTPISLEHVDKRIETFKNGTQFIAQPSQNAIVGVAKLPALRVDDKALDALAKVDEAIKAFGSDTKDGLKTAAVALEAAAKGGTEIASRLENVAGQLDATTQKMADAFTHNVSTIANTAEKVTTQTTSALNETTEKLQKIADNTTKSLNNFSFDTRLALDKTTKETTKTVDYAIQEAKQVVNKSMPQLIKTAAVSGAGLACSIGGIILFVKGIQKAYASYKQETTSAVLNQTFLQRCKNVLTHPAMQGMYQAGAGLATFAAGIITIAKSEQIIAYFA